MERGNNIPTKMRVGIKKRIVPHISMDYIVSKVDLVLDGETFDIKPVTSEKGTWDVTPLKSGLQQLILSTGSTPTEKMPSHNCEVEKYVIKKYEINVEPNRFYNIKIFVKTYWQWIIRTLFGTGIIYLIAKLI